jgi:hypothetical protein
MWDESWLALEIYLACSPIEPFSLLQISHNPYFDGVHERLSLVGEFVASTNCIRPTGSVLGLLIASHRFLRTMENDYLYVGVWKGKRIRGA